MPERESLYVILYVILFVLFLVGVGTLHDALLIGGMFVTSLLWNGDTPRMTGREPDVDSDD